MNLNKFKDIFNVNGNDLYNFAKDLWHFDRSITGDGVRKTLYEIKKQKLPNLKIHEVKSGTKVFDWEVPNEWSVKNAFIITPKGEKICDFKVNNLHLLGYSIPIQKSISLEKLKSHLYTIPEQPEAIPYRTSYYQKRWGFCISYNDYKRLENGEYKVFIDSNLFKGNLTYGDLIIKGKTKKEVLISTYICHPSMANNELSGPVVSAFIANKISLMPKLRYTYRFIYIPETIGSITYLSKNLKYLKRNLHAGFNLTCIGDDRDYSYLSTRKGNTISDNVAKHVLTYNTKKFTKYEWGSRGSDERQFCAPGVDLPIASLMRTKYMEYPEYHTSLDNLKTIVNPAGLKGGFDIVAKSIEVLENNITPKVKVLCEPNLAKRGLYPTLSTKESGLSVRMMMDLISYSDGSKTLLEIADILNVSMINLIPMYKKLKKEKLLEAIK